MDSAKVPQNRARLAMTSSARSPRSDAEAICRVPTVPTPAPARTAAVVMMLVNSPIRPTPAGPIMTATTLVLSRPMAMLMTEAPPMIDEVRRIWR